MSEASGAKEKDHDHHTRRREFFIGQRVLVRNLRDGPHWLQGTIIGQKRSLSYLVQLTSGAVWRRQIDHILESVDSPQEEPVTPEPIISVPEELPSPSSTPVDITPPTVPVTEQSDISTDETGV